MTGPHARLDGFSPIHGAKQRPYWVLATFDDSRSRTQLGWQRNAPVCCVVGRPGISMFGFVARGTAR
jgi:hypothetical protein